MKFKVLVPSIAYTAWLIFWAAITTVLLIAGRGSAGHVPHSLIHLNELAVKESLSTAAEIFLGLAMLPGLAVIVLALKTKSAAERAQVLKTITLSAFSPRVRWVALGPLSVFKRSAWTAKYAALKWMHRRGGKIWWVLQGMDILMTKAGSTILSVLLGCTVYFALVKLESWWLVLGTIALTYAMTVFPDYIRQRAQKILLKPYQANWWMTKV